MYDTSALIHDMLAEILDDMMDLSAMFDVQNTFGVRNGFLNLISKIKLLLTVDGFGTVLGDFESGLIDALGNSFKAQKDEDYQGLAYIIKVQLFPIIQCCQRKINEFLPIVSIDNSDIIDRLKGKDSLLAELIEKSEDIHASSKYSSCVYDVSYSDVGYYSLAIHKGEKNVTIHGNDNPRFEARRLINEEYDPKVDNYIVLGLGLGYHIEELHKKNPYMRIEICEPDIGVIKLAFMYRDMNWYYSSDVVHINYDPDLNSLYRLLDETNAKLIVLPAYINHLMACEDVVTRLRDCVARDSRIRYYKQQFETNFYSNVKHVTKNVSDLESLFNNKNVIIVAAGPSLDKNIDKLKNVPQNVTVVAVGAVLKKMIALGVLPDAIIDIDSDKELLDHYSGCLNLDIPLIIFPTAYLGLAIEYRGDKYLAYQKGYYLAEQYARQTGCELYESGGTVTSAALDIVLKMGISSVAFVGLDLAFSDGKRHASGIYEEKEIHWDDTLLVEDINGNMIPTCRRFSIWKEWIERKICCKDCIIPVYDATEGGAIIKGTSVIELAELIEGYKGIC